MLQCILQLYIENTVASPWCCSPCYGRSREQRAEKKRSEAIKRPPHSTAVGCFWGRSPCMEILARTDSNLSTVQLPKWEALCMANEPEGEPSELGRTTCHSLSSKRLSHFFESKMFMQTCAACTCPMRSTDDGDPQA